MSLVAIAFYQGRHTGTFRVGRSETGTKGKTTTTYFMKNILDAFCRRKSAAVRVLQKSAVLSTVEVDTGIEHHEAHLTTPESPDLAALLCTKTQRQRYLPFLTM